MSFKSWFGALEEAGSSWLGVGIFILIWIWSLVFSWSIFQIVALLILKVERTSIPSSANLGLWRMLEVPNWDFAPWYWFGYGHWYLVHPYSKFCLSTWILKVQGTSVSFKSWFGALEDAGGSWLGFGILTLIRIWSLVFDIPIFQILAFYLDFEGAKNVHVL